MIDKDIVRNKYKAIRKNISNKEFKDNLINEKIIKLDVFKKSKTIALYCSKSEEINLDKVFYFAKKSKKTIVFPSIFKNSMYFYKVDSLKELTEISSFNIKEPKKDISKLVNIEDIDLAIFPGIAFNIYNERIGYGKGYYDSYFKQKNKTFKIGVCYQECLLNERFNLNNFDINVDLVITD